MQVELVNEDDTLSALRRLASVLLIEHYGARGNVAHHREEYVETVRQLGPRGHVPVFEVDHRTAVSRLVPDASDSGRGSHHRFRDRRGEKTLFLTFLPANRIAENLVGKPMEQRAIIETGIEGRGISGPPVPRGLPPSATSSLPAHTTRS